ncbi:MAG: hypothetical protein ACRCV9_13865, partial [Burkholderiaceae bacterium]
QTTSNVNTATANTILGNANETGPLGSVKYNITGYQTVNGQKVPQYEKVTSLSPGQQKLYDQQTQLGSQMNGIAGRQLNTLDRTLSTPISTDGLPAAVNSINAPKLGMLNGQLQTSFADAGDIQRSVGANDFSQDRLRVEDAINSRLEPQLQRDRSALESQLANQGIAPGSEAWREAIALNDRSRNDARMQTVLAGGQEQSRMFGMDLSQGQFANSAQQQQYNQNMGRAGFYNDATMSGLGFDNAAATGQFALDQQAAQFSNTSRERALQEEMMLRNQPINEIGALMGGGQVTLPQFAQYQGGNIAGTDVAGITQQSYQNQMQQYQQRLQQQNAMMGGLAGLGGSLLAAPMTGGGSVGGAMMGGLGFGR